MLTPLQQILKELDKAKLTVQKVETSLRQYMAVQKAAEHSYRCTGRTTGMFRKAATLAFEGKTVALILPAGMFNVWEEYVAHANSIQVKDVHKNITAHRVNSISASVFLGSDPVTGPPVFQLSGGKHADVVLIDHHLIDSGLIKI